ncbi:MAG: GatB/YqeY domain-containing protein [Clostridia bacterium]
MLVDELKKANIIALKAKDAVARSILSVVLNKTLLATISKRESGAELTDADVVSILQKTQKELVEEREGYEKVGNEARVAEIIKQQEVVAKFIPSMMSVEDILSEIATLQDKSIPAVMKHFKANFAGKCDMRDVQSALKQL